MFAQPAEHHKDYAKIMGGLWAEFGRYLDGWGASQTAIPTACAVGIAVIVNRRSLIVLSLNHYLTSVHDIHTLGGLRYAAAREVVN